METSATCTSDKESVAKKVNKYSCKFVPEKHINLYSNTDSIDTNPVAKFGKGNFTQSPASSNSFVMRPQKKNHSNGSTNYSQSNSFKSPKVETPTQSTSSIKIQTVGSKTEATKWKFAATDTQLVSPSSTPHKSFGSNLSKNSIQGFKKNDDSTSIYINKKSNDFKVKYKTEKCKFFDLYKECKYGDNVSYIF